MKLSVAALALGLAATQAVTAKPHPTPSSFFSNPVVSTTAPGFGGDKCTVWVTRTRTRTILVPMTTGVATIADPMTTGVATTVVPIPSGVATASWGLYSSEVYPTQYPTGGPYSSEVHPTQFPTGKHLTSVRLASKALPTHSR